MFNILFGCVLDVGRSRSGHSAQFIEFGSLFLLIFGVFGVDDEAEVFGFDV